MENTAFKIYENISRNCGASDSAVQQIDVTSLP
jgi:hypothetical protein